VTLDLSKQHNTHTGDPTMTTTSTISNGTITATYKQLKNGAWGMRVKGIVLAGEQITVTKKDGSSKVETIGRVLWTGEGISICTIQRAATGSRGYTGHRNGRRYECDECGELVTAGDRSACWETGCTH
jgi:hypothetical protein